MWDPPRLVLVLASAAAAVLGTALGALAAEEPDSCLACHSTEAKAAGAPRGRRIDAAAFRETLHGESCVQCHQDAEEETPHPTTLAKVDCALCHEEAAERFRATPHGRLSEIDGQARAMACADCHDPHAVFPATDERSSVQKRHQPATCAKCHGRTERAGGDRIPQTVKDFTRSVHGVELLEEANGKAPACDTCHPIHDLRPRGDPKSSTFKPNVPALCGQCHGDIAAQFGKSVHGTALAKGKLDSPSCTDCHSEHAIRRPEDPESTIYGTHVSATCSSCHAAERIVRKYGLPADRVGTYRDSYHGLADREGYTAAANCASCHGVHDILPSWDPQSAIHGDNLLQTCSKCHQGATAGFVDGPIHAKADPDEAKAAYWVRFAYLILIPAVIGGMLLHNLVILGRYLVRKYRAQKSMKRYRRFTRAEVVSHALLALSFVLLAVTGFALKFPEAWWSDLLAFLGMSEPVRGGIHRGAGVLLLGVGAFHVVYSLATKQGRYGLVRMVPTLQDGRDAVRNLAWHLGLAKSRPRFDRFDYTMKAEYWALVWGTFLMGLTGAVLWFKVDFTRWIPLWMVFVAENIHYYEAILAALAIVVWHFFFVAFHPEEYPMSLTWITGTKTEEEMAHHHPLELERLRAAEEAARAGPPAPAEGSNEPEPGETGSR